MPDGRVYVGGFRGDRMHGHGRLRRRDGSVIFEGFWVNGRMRTTSKLLLCCTFVAVLMLLLVFCAEPIVFLLFGAESETQSVTLEL